MLREMQRHAGAGTQCLLCLLFLQPRRIVAMSIAERVASERDEILGKSVGYQVLPQRTNIGDLYFEYCFK